MNPEVLKTLWLLRFEKIKKTEEEAAWGYQEILDKCLVEFGPTHKVIQLLQSLVHDERAHAKMADELIKICQQSHPEISAL